MSFLQVQPCPGVPSWEETWLVCGHRAYRTAGPKDRSKRSRAATVAVGTKSIYRDCDDCRAARCFDDLREPYELTADDIQRIEQTIAAADARAAAQAAWRAQPKPPAQTLMDDHVCIGGSVYQRTPEPADDGRRWRWLGEARLGDPAPAAQYRAIRVPPSEPGRRGGL